LIDAPAVVRTDNPVNRPTRPSVPRSCQVPKFQPSGATVFAPAGGLVELISVCLALRCSGHLEFRTSGILEVQKSRILDFWTSGLPENWTSLPVLSKIGTGRIFAHPTLIWRLILQVPDHWIRPLVLPAPQIADAIPFGADGLFDGLEHKVFVGCKDLRQRSRLREESGRSKIYTHTVLVAPYATPQAQLVS